MSLFVLGTAQFGLDYGINNNCGQVSYDNTKEVLEYAHSNGIDMLDTAITYGDCEQRIGKIGIKDWKVVTKLPDVPEDCKNISLWVEDSINQSLQRLGVKNLYGLLLHKPKKLFEHQGSKLYKTLERLKNTGLIQKIGVSIYDPLELDKLCDSYQIDIVQSPFNIFDRRMIDSGWLSRLFQQKIELHVRSIFLQGLLLMSPSSRPQKFKRWSSLWELWDNWLKNSKLTPIQACLRYVNSFPEITKVVIGVNNLKQLNEIFEEVSGVISKPPAELNSRDLNLINPSMWSNL